MSGYPLYGTAVPRSARWDGVFSKSRMPWGLLAGENCPGAPLAGLELLVTVGPVFAHGVSHSVESGAIIPGQGPQSLGLGIRVAPRDLEGLDPFLLHAAPLFSSSLGSLPLCARPLPAAVFERRIEAESGDGPVGLQPGRQRRDEPGLRAGLLLLDDVAPVAACEEVLVYIVAQKRFLPDPPGLLLRALGCFGAGDLLPGPLEALARLRQPSIPLVAREVFWLVGWMVRR